MVVVHSIIDTDVQGRGAPTTLDNAVNQFRSPVARSHEDQFILALRGFTHEKASFTKLADALGPKWTTEAVEAKARTFDGNDEVPIHVVRGGVQYFGTETGTKPGLYKEIRRGIQGRWGSDNSMRNATVLHTSRTSERGQGRWTQPDLVAQVRRRSDASPQTVYLAIEVEQAGGFDVMSVYQAYEFGRGADFSWVFYEGPASTGGSWEQIETAAQDLGVGIVHAARPTVPSRWKTVVPARLRQRTQAEQKSFFKRSGVTPQSFGPES